MERQDPDVDTSWGFDGEQGWRLFFCRVLLLVRFLERAARLLINQRAPPSEFGSV